MGYPWKIHYVTDKKINTTIYAPIEVDIHTHGLKKIMGKELECVIQIPSTFIAALMNRVGELSMRGDVFGHGHTLVDNATGKAFGLVETLNGSHLRIICPDRNGCIDPDLMEQEFLFQFKGTKKI